MTTGMTQWAVAVYAALRMCELALRDFELGFMPWQRIPDVVLDQDMRAES